MRTEQEWAISVTLLCSLSGHTRQAYYKQGQYKERGQFAGELIISQVIAYRQLQSKLGSRKLLWLLQPFMARHGISLGRDQFIELLRKQGLLLGKKRNRKPNTTFSGHSLRKYPNLVEKLTPVAPGGVWVSDITYIELSKGPAFLSLVTDAYSRKVVGYHLCEHLSAHGPIAALQMAIAGCNDTSGLIHHSDRGVQYCCNAYIELLKQADIAISMTQSGDPRDNAIAERVNGILKGELLEVAYPDIAAARAGIKEAVSIYNYLRPHSSLAMLTPAIAHGRSGNIRRCWGHHYKRKNAPEVAAGT